MKRKFKSQFDKRPVSGEVWPCDNVLEGDGEDPRYSKHPRKRAPNRKALQLCAQVRDAINLILAGAHNGILQELMAENVVPAPDSTNLLITIAPAWGHDWWVAEPEMIQDSLQYAYTWIRSEVAKEIHRKKVPQLQLKLKEGLGFLPSRI